MNVLILGGNGFLGPHVVAQLQGHHHLRITDVVPIVSPHEHLQVDIADLAQVRAAARGMDAVVNCSVQRQDRLGAFAVNVRGTYNALRAAAEVGVRRFVNTGPRFTLVGPSYLEYDFGICEHIPPHPGTGLYALSKSLGHELCRVFAENAPLHVLTLLFSSFVEPRPAPGQAGGDFNPFAVTFADAARAVHRALEVDARALPSRCEVFFITAPLPHGVCRDDKARRLLGWEPQDSLEAYWRRPPSAGRIAGGRPR